MKTSRWEQSAIIGGDSWHVLVEGRTVTVSCDQKTVGQCLPNPRKVEMDLSKPWPWEVHRAWVRATDLLKREGTYLDQE